MLYWALTTLYVVCVVSLAFQYLPQNHEVFAVCVTFQYPCQIPPSLLHAACVASVWECLRWTLECLMQASATLTLSQTLLSAS